VISAPYGGLDRYFTI